MKATHLIVCITVFCFIALSSQQNVGGYKKLSPKQVYKNSAARKALNVGAQKVVQKAIEENKIPKGKY